MRARGDVNIYIRTNYPTRTNYKMLSLPQCTFICTGDIIKDHVLAYKVWGGTFWTFSVK
jgi:hypothetical protein